MFTLPTKLNVRARISVDCGTAPSTVGHPDLESSSSAPRAFWEN